MWRPWLLGLGALLWGACAPEPAPEPAEGTCSAPRLVCDGVCVDPNTHPAHCGACNQSCADGAVCLSGQCVLRCDENERSCGGRCVDVTRDALHCGACERSCGDAEECVEGKCVDACPEGWLRCGVAGCVDPDRDIAHCGGCDAPCADGFRCFDGTCACPEGWERCGDRCVDVDRDYHHCGGCDRSCPSAQACIDGSCQCAGTTACGEVCADLMQDPEFCGSCERSCLSGPQVDAATCHAGLCALVCTEGFADCDEDPDTGCEQDLRSDVDNCGACGLRCADLPGIEALEGCGKGRCLYTCKKGLANCSGDSARGCDVELAVDVENCGACFRSCLGRSNVDHARCADGVCGIHQCAPGTLDCDEDFDTGCEVDGDRDPQNCGGCGSTCGAACRGGTCREVEVLALGARHSCALFDDGVVECWGANERGELGDGTDKSRSQPAPVFGLEGGVSLSSVYQHACAVTAGGEVWCWGWNDSDQIGGGMYVQTSPFRILQVPKAIAVVVGGHHSCALLENGESWCWGDNGDGQLGAESSESTSATPLRVEGLPASVEVVLGTSHSCARDAAGAVRCWGRNTFGQLGAEGSSRSTPQVVELPPSKGLAAGYAHTCALSRDGEVWCWGWNHRGQAGNGSVQQSAVPHRLSLKGIVEIGASAFNTCARTEAGAIWCWGHNDRGQLGDGGVIESTPIPQRISAPELSRGFAVGEQHVCSVGAESGAVYCWGAGGSGRLGTGDTFDRAEPDRVRW